MFRVCWCVLCSISLLSDYMCMRLTFIPWSIEGLPSSQALPGLLITAPPSVCVPDVIGALAVWIRNQKKNRVFRVHKGGISSKGQQPRHAGIQWRRAWWKQWQNWGVSAGACVSHRPTEHGTPPPTQHRPLPSLSLHMRNLLGQCILSCTQKCAPHLPNTRPKFPPKNGVTPKLPSEVAHCL